MMEVRESGGMKLFKYFVVWAREENAWVNFAC